MNLPNDTAAAYRHVTLACMWDDIRHGMREKLAELGIEAPPIEPWTFIHPQDRDSEEEAFILTPPDPDWVMPPSPTCPLCKVPAVPMAQVEADGATWLGFECPNVLAWNPTVEHDAGRPLADILPVAQTFIPWPFDRPALNEELEALGFIVEHV